MKKSARVLLIIVCILLVGAFGFVYYIEAKTEDVLVQELSKNHINVQNVDYNYLLNTLEFENVKGVDPGNPALTFDVEHVLLTSPNLEALNPQAGDYPTVVEEMLFTNSEISYTLLGKKMHIHIAKISVRDWRQNLGNYFLSLQNKYSERFFAQLLNAYISGCELSEITTISNFMGDEKNITKRIMVQDITPTKIGSYSIEGLSSTSGQGRVGTIYTDIALTQVNNLKLPSAKLLSVLATYIFAQQEDLEQNISQEEEILTLMAEYFQSGLEPEFKVQALDTGFLQEKTKESILSFEDCILQGKYEANNAQGFLLKQELKNLQINVEAVDKTRFLDITKAMLQSPIIQANMSVNGIFHDNNSLSSLNFELENTKLGTVQASWNFLLPWKDQQEMLKAILSNANLSSIIQIMLTQNIHFSFDDTGLLARILRTVSQLNNMSLEQALPLLHDYTDKNVASLKSFLKESNFNALNTCLKNPGKLSLNVKFEKPASNMGITWQALRDPMNFPLEIICKPKGNILEAAQKLP